MERYRGLEVPELNFHNPAGSIMYPRGLYTYGMGNTRCRDLTELLVTTQGQHLDLLLLASGDVRNLLHTVAELSLRKPHCRPKSLGFHLNDYDQSLVARNAILLEVMSLINPSVQDDLDFLWNIWYNMTLSNAHFYRLREIISFLADRDFGNEGGFLTFSDTSVHRECRRIWMDWKDLDLEVTSVQQERKRFMKQRMGDVQMKQEDMCLNVVTQMIMASNFEADKFSEESQFYKEIEHWFDEGSSDRKLDRVNPTLICPFAHTWKQHYASCAFEGYLPLEGEDLKRYGTITAACKGNLRAQLERFQHFRDKCDVAIKVMLWTGDALSLCVSGLSRELLFDVIDTSNVSDYIGLLNVLVCCGPKLKRPNESQLFTASMIWSASCTSVEEYYNKCVGVPTHLLPTVLGLKLAVDLDLGASKLPDRANRTEEILCWVQAEHTRSLLSLDETSDVLHALLRLVERCFNLVDVYEHHVYGVRLPSPLTFLRVVQQIQPLIKGGASRIFPLLEARLADGFNKKFNFSWNLLKAAVGCEKEPIVEVKVRCDVSVSSWCISATPVPMIVFEDEYAPMQWMLSQLPYSFLPRDDQTLFPVIYNSLRYDKKAKTVTFHLCKRDWTKLRANAWLRVVSSDLMPTLNNNPVFLGDDQGVISVSGIDPVETFGLYSVQNFSVVSSNKDSQVVKILKVEENRHSYTAELQVLDTTKCKAKTMRVVFQPTECPTEVSIQFEGASGGTCTIYFSCPVEDKTSKFQISRKEGKVFCQLLKREDGTVGERVIQNVATIPFHTMKPWDVKLHSMSTVCGKMFRTELDQQHKRNGEGGSPFYDLRESITMIFRKHVDDPQLPIIHCVEEREVVLSPYQTPQDISQKKGLVIKVHELYKWKHLPFAKVLFYDCERFGNSLLGHPNAPESVRIASTFFSVALFHGVHRIATDMKEITLFRKMLYTNSARVEQDQESGSVWKCAFISLLFPRETCADLIAIRENFGERGTFPTNPVLVSNVRVPEVDALNPQLASRGDSASQASNAALHSAPECSFCHRKSTTLKRCMGCKTVFYCGKDCQSRDWKNHKVHCRK